ncbi:hypothetical protein [Sphingomonas sp.]|uniref:hypothetical protein n=1 Tax=Sphingomonas sp. TaxID=28214 RepID=UPI002DD6B0FD|nr:hypothetical protein [Sphingomonas sp.]
MRSAFLIVPALLLAGCGSADEAAKDEGTSISIKGEDGNAFSANLGKDGRVAIDVPGFKANIDLPSIQLDANDFKMNGVSLPTGSKITSMNVAGRNGGGVEVNFTSPVGTAAVRDWFQGRLAAEGFTLKADGDALSGTTEEGKPFRLTTKPAGGGQSESVISIGG